MLVGFTYKHHDDDGEERSGYAGFQPHNTVRMVRTSNIFVEAGVLSIRETGTVKKMAPLWCSSLSREKVRADHEMMNLLKLVD